MPGAPSTPHVRDAVPADIPALLAIQHAAFAIEAARNGAGRIPPLTETASQVAADLDDPAVAVLVAVDGDGDVIGSGRLRVDGPVARVERISVDPAHHGTGVGGTVLRALHARAPDCVTAFELVTGAASVGNLRWYGGHGYVRSGSAYDADGVELVVMRRTR